MATLLRSRKKQATKVPQYYGEKLVYQINQTGYLKLMTGKTLAPISISQAATHDKVKTLWLDEFQAKSVFLNDKTNVLNYRIFTPHFEQGKAYPLTIFFTWFRASWLRQSSTFIIQQRRDFHVAI